jgi:Xaa-Pro aminopeptidase
MKVNRYAPLVTPTSTKELARRRAAVQARMKEDGVDCLLLYASYLRQGGGIRYFLDFPTSGTNALYGILPQEGGMSVFGHGHKNGPTVPKSVAYDVEVNYGYPFAVVFPFTLHHIFDTVVEYVKKRNFKTIGLYRRGILPYEFVNCIAENVPGVSFVDVDDLIDEIAAIKSEAELDILRDVCALHDKVYAALPTIIRPGKREKDLANEIQDICSAMDCEALNIMIGAGNPMAHHKHYPFQNNVIKENDYIDLLVEVSSPGNYFGELSRMWSLGEPSQEMIDLNNDSLKAQDILAETARPGTPAAKMMEVLHQFQREHGYKLEDRFFGHGQGLDLTQRPLFDYEETMILKENMFISIHPAMENDTLWAFNTDNYIITQDGAVRVNKTPRGIFRP